MPQARGKAESDEETRWGHSKDSENATQLLCVTQGCPGDGAPTSSMSYQQAQQLVTHAEAKGKIVHEGLHIKSTEDLILS